jgi:hypothetical protein
VDRQAQVGSQGGRYYYIQKKLPTLPRGASGYRGGLIIEEGHLPTGLHLICHVFPFFSILPLWNRERLSSNRQPRLHDALAEFLECNADVLFRYCSVLSLVALT